MAGEKREICPTWLVPSRSRTVTVADAGLKFRSMGMLTVSYGKLRKEFQLAIEPQFFRASGRAKPFCWCRPDAKGRSRQTSGVEQTLGWGPPRRPPQSSVVELQSDCSAEIGAVKYSVARHISLLVPQPGLTGSLTLVVS